MREKHKKKFLTRHTRRDALFSEIGLTRKGKWPSLPERYNFLIVSNTLLIYRHRPFTKSTINTSLEIQ